MGGSAFAPTFYISACFFNPATSLTLHEPFDLELILALKTHAIA